MDVLLGALLRKINLSRGSRKTFFLKEHIGTPSAKHTPQKYLHNFFLIKQTLRSYFPSTLKLYGRLVMLQILLGNFITDIS